MLYLRHIGPESPLLLAFPVSNPEVHPRFRSQMGNSRNEPPPNRRGRRPQRKTQMSPLLSSICFVPGDGRTKISTEESPFFRALPEKKPKEEEGILYSSRGTERDRHATDGRAGKIVELREQKLREIERAFLGPRGGLLRSPDTEDELRKIQHQNNPCCRQMLSHTKICLKSPGTDPKASSAHSPGRSVPGLMRQTLAKFPKTNFPFSKSNKI